MRLLAWFVVRALAVTVLMATLLMPVADHHALARLLDLNNGHPDDAHWLLVHHHGTSAAHRAGPSTAPAPTGLPSLSPYTAPADAAASAAPVVVLVALLALSALAGWRVRAQGVGLPTSADRAVPVPPPRAVLLAA